jgi:hypothetical protein
MEESYLVRDKTGAILNTDNKGLDAYRKRREIKNSTNDRLSRLEEDISLIKRLLLENLK